jgi:hypothetical protein
MNFNILSKALLIIQLREQEEKNKLMKESNSVSNNDFSNIIETPKGIDF